MKSMFWVSFVVFAIFTLGLEAFDHSKAKDGSGKVGCVICEVQKD